MAKGKRKYTPRKSKEDVERIVRQAIQLMSAPKNRLNAEKCAQRLGVSKQWIYYHVGAPRNFMPQLKAA